MRVFGIDPGSRFLGYGGVEERAGKALCHVAHGVVKVDARAPLELRLRELFEALQQQLALYRPDAVAVEGVFTFKNARSALILGHARGVALLVAAQANLTVHEYPPAQVKRAVGAGGAGGKDAVARMVTRFLRIELAPNERADASDALAVALCHLNQGKGLRATAAASPQARGTKGALAALGSRLQPSVQRFEGRR